MSPVRAWKILIRKIFLFSILVLLILLRSYASLAFAGVEPILHEDISTHMCACVGGTISVTVVIITTYIMIHQTDDRVTDWQVTQNMLLSFVLCYTLVFTVMEPLRAAIKAVYVSFAQHPRSLSQAFPLIFHRLSRLSESNVN